MFGGSKGKGKGYNTYSRAGTGYGSSSYYDPPEQSPDRLPGVADRLSQVKAGLTEEAAKAYQALQIALQRHSDPHGSRVNFENMFYDCLSAVFPDAWDVQARQIGGQNQWEVTVDGGEPVYCSVRLEVLSDNPEFLKDVKAKARVVKETLLEDEGRWKRTLQPEYGFLSMEKLSQFEQECAERASSMDFGGGSRYGGKGGNQWVDQASLCSICGRSKHDDILNGVHMCVVMATFRCPDCKYSWTSHHGRLKPDGATLMGQQCSKCRGQGVSVEWTVVSRQQREYDQDNNFDRSKGTHQNELCDACREFGNCTGVFYDPFILTTALSIMTDTEVTWKSFSSSMPELLVADLGPGYSELQVCLQPHVYVPSNDKRWCGTYKNRGGRGPRGYTDNSYDREYDRDEYDRPPRRGSGRGGSQYSQEYTSYVAPPLRSTERPSGGVKDQAAYQRYLSQPSAGSDARSSHAGGAASLEVPAPRPSKGKGKGMGEIDEDDDLGEGQPSSSSSRLGAASGMPGSGGGMLQANKFNKIDSEAPAAAASGGGVSSTPRLDALLPLRRAQFLQLMKRQDHSFNYSEKCQLAEEYLALCGGDFDKAYQYVKQLQ